MSGPPHPDRRALLAGLALASGFACTALPAHARARGVELPYPGPRDTCPVCGMFVARYPHWVAVVTFKDGKAAYFDGAKDFFKFLLDMPRYAPGRSRSDILAMGVSDYYATARIAAEEALYVIGSDVLGPMGHELVPLADDEDTRDFMKDHKGRRILRFSEVAMPLLEALDAGRFE